MKIKERTFRIKDVDCKLIVEITDRQKDILMNLDEYVENLQYDISDGTDDSFEILYTDGSWDYIGSDYDGHRIKRRNIAAMVHNNPCTSIVYGKFGINRYGVVSVMTDGIDTENITEIRAS